MRRYKKFFINGIIITITSLLMRSVSISFHIYISNKVGAEAIGLFSLVMSIYLFTITLATSGINLASSRILAEETALHSDFNGRKFMKTSLIYSLSLSLITSLLLCLFAGPIAKSILHDKLPASILYIVAASLPFIAMSAALNGYFTALRKASKNAISRVFEQFIKIVSTTYLISLLFPDGVFYACLSLVLGETISEIASFFFTYFLYQIDSRQQTSTNGLTKKYLKRILKITIPVSITSYLRSGLSSLKQILIPFQLEKSGMACDTSLAQYGKINTMAMQMLLFPEVLINSFSSLLVPEFAYYATRKQEKSIHYIIAKIFKVSLLYAVAISSIFYFYADSLSYFVYQDWEVASYVKIISPLLIFMFLDSAVDNMLKGLGKQLGVMYCNILDSIVCICLIYCLIPSLGIKGYLVIIFLSEILNCGISILQLWFATRFKIDLVNWIIKPVTSSLLSRLSILLLPLPKTCTLGSLAFQIMCFILLYLLYLNLFHTFSFSLPKIQFFYQPKSK